MKCKDINLPYKGLSQRWLVAGSILGHNYQTALNCLHNSVHPSACDHKIQKSGLFSKVGFGQMLPYSRAIILIRERATET